MPSWMCCFGCGLLGRCLYVALLLLYFDLIWDGGVFCEGGVALGFSGFVDVVLSLLDLACLR